MPANPPGAERPTAVFPTPDETMVAPRYALLNLMITAAVSSDLLVRADCNKLFDAMRKAKEAAR